MLFKWFWYFFLISFPLYCLFLYHLRAYPLILCFVSLNFNCSILPFDSSLFSLQYLSFLYFFHFLVPIPVILFLILMLIPLLLPVLLLVTLLLLSLILMLFTALLLPVLLLVALLLLSLVLLFTALLLTVLLLVTLILLVFLHLHS